MEIDKHVNLYIYFQMEATFQEILAKLIMEFFSIKILLTNMKGNGVMINLMEMEKSNQIRVSTKAILKRDSKMEKEL